MTLRDSLAEAAEQMPVARLTPDVWRRGREARRWGRLRGVLAGFAALLVAVAVPLTAGVTVGSPQRVDAVPAELSLPWMWQATVQQDPPGPASVLFGGDTIGLRGSDLFDSEGKLAAVGRGGDYRTLLYAGVDSIAAGEDVLLSPDGSQVAQGFLSGVDGQGLIVTDLGTGASTIYPGTLGPGCCTPVAWAPDGKALLATQAVGEIAYDETGTGMVPTRLVWLDLTSGDLTILGPKRLTQKVRTASQGAISPDGRLVALTEDTSVSLANVTGETLWTVDLGPRTYLAGIGAFTPDGTRVTTVTLDGCLDECDTAALAARRWTFGYIDVRTGTRVPAAALAPVTGMAVRVLGWSQGRDLVALRYTPEAGAQKTRDSTWNDTGWYETGHVTLIALRPDGTTATLLDPPAGVLTMDVARDLIEAGRFGGPSWTAAPFPARPMIWAPLVCPLLVTTVVLTWMSIAARRRRRRQPAQAPPALPDLG